MGAAFCRRPVILLTLEKEKVLGNPMIQLKTIELFLHIRIEGVYSGMALYDNTTVVWLRTYLISGQTTIGERNQRRGWA